MGRKRGSLLWYPLKMRRAALSCAVLALAAAACGTSPQTGAGSAEAVLRAAIGRLKTSKALIAQISMVTVNHSSISPMRQSGTFHYAAPGRLAIYSANWSPGFECSGGQPVLVIDNGVGFVPVPPQCRKWSDIPKGYDAKALIFMPVEPALYAKDVARKGDVYSFAYVSSAKGWTTRRRGSMIVTDGSVTSANLDYRIEPPASGRGFASTVTVAATYRSVSPLKVRIPVPPAASVSKLGQVASLGPPGRQAVAS